MRWEGKVRGKGKGAYRTRSGRKVVRNGAAGALESGERYRFLAFDDAMTASPRDLGKIRFVDPIAERIERSCSVSRCYFFFPCRKLPKSNASSSSCPLPSLLLPRRSRLPALLSLPSSPNRKLRFRAWSAGNGKALRAG